MESGRIQKSLPAHQHRKVTFTEIVQVHLYTFNDWQNKKEKCTTTTITQTRCCIDKHLISIP